MKTLRTLFLTPLQWSVGLHIGAAVVALIGFQLAANWLNASYVASLHPTDVMTGQTGFDAGLVKGYYASMEAAGTLGIYVKTQLIDFSFILGFALFGWLWGTLAARFNSAGSWGARIGLFAAALIVFGTLMDVAENLVSFVMLANPQGFADGLIYIYSGFAVVKYAALMPGVCLIALAFVIAAVSWGLRKLRPAT